MRRWLITGTSSGLGRAVAEAALAVGDEVAGTARDAAACAAFEALVPGRSIGLRMEARDAMSVSEAVAEAERRLGGIDILVANAGRGLVGALEETSLAEIRDLFEINVFGAIALMQAVLPGMRSRGAGHIVNVTSVSGLAPWVGTSVYGATKYAMECVGATLAAEVAEFGIRVTNVAPGGLRTNFSGRSLAVADAQIAAYDGAARDAERSFTANRGDEPGDPQRAAATILELIGMTEPPLHLLLGEDALHYAEHNMLVLQQDMMRWRELSLSISQDAAPEALN